MDKIEDELTKEEKKFLDKMFGNRQFLDKYEQVDSRKHPPVTDEETFGGQLSSYLLKGPNGVDDENRDVFYSAWQSDDDFGFVWLDGLSYLLLYKAIYEVGTSGLEWDLNCQLKQIGDNFSSERVDQYSFAQFLTLLSSRTTTLEGQQDKVIKRPISISEEGLKFMIKCAEYVKDLLKVFKFDTDKVLAKYFAEAGWQTKVECYKRYYQDRDKQKVIAADLGISQSSVANYIDEVQGRLSREMGHAFEDYFASTIAPRIYDKYERKGAKGEPDGIGYREGILEVVSLKCYDE